MTNTVTVSRDVQVKEEDAWDCNVVHDPSTSTSVPVTMERHETEYNRADSDDE